MVRIRLVGTAVAGPPITGFVDAVLQRVDGDGVVAIAREPPERVVGIVPAGVDDGVIGRQVVAVNHEAESVVVVLHADRARHAPVAVGHLRGGVGTRIHQRIAQTVGQRAGRVEEMLVVPERHPASREIAQRVQRQARVVVIGDGIRPG